MKSARARSRLASSDDQADGDGDHRKDESDPDAAKAPPCSCDGDVNQELCERLHKGVVGRSTIPGPCERAGSTLGSSATVAVY